jgi:hypothetical protein
MQALLDSQDKKIVKLVGKVFGDKIRAGRYLVEWLDEPISNLHSTKDVEQKYDENISLGKREVVVEESGKGNEEELLPII